jgi:AIR synthase-related protein
MGGRLVVSSLARRSGMGAGARLVRAACATAEAEGALRFEATVQEENAAFFEALGWEAVRPVSVARAPHRLMRWPVRRLQRLVEATKRPLGELLRGLRPGGERWVGDDAAPVPGSELVAGCDAILPAMVARDPEWAGWCGVLVSANDLAAMGAARLGCLDALAAPDAAHAARVMDGVREGAAAFGLPVLGGHTQLGVAPALSVTALGRTAHPVPGGGGRPGDDVVLTADLAGCWRPGYEGSQWDSTSGRRAAEIGAMLDAVAAGRPRAAKDVSMAGIGGTLAMLAEAGGCGAELDLARLPRPEGVRLADWLTCFPGFALLSADSPGRALPAGPAVNARCGRLVPGAGVRLVWPDGETVQVLDAGATGLGRA